MFRTYLQPFSCIVLKSPATILEMRIPIVINNWLIVTSRPRISAGAASATYTGMDMEANPGKKNNVNNDSVYTLHICRFVAS